MSDLIAWFGFLSKVLSDPVLKSAAEKFLEWFRSLPSPQQLAYASKYTLRGGLGCAEEGCDCPECPDDCRAIEEALVTAMTGDE